MKNGMGGSGRFFDAVAVDCASAFPQGSAEHCPMILTQMQRSLAG